MKIIQIIENLDKGAVENWLVNVFLTSQPIQPDLQWTFYCILGRPGRLDDIVQKAGGKIIYAPVTISQKWIFLKHFRSTLKAGQYDIIHVHHDYLSGFYLLATIGIKFKKRLLHIHNTDKALPVGNSLLAKLLLKPFKMLALALSDVVVGISKECLEDFLGEAPLKSPRSTLLYCGINLQTYATTIDKLTLKEELKIPAQAKIMLFVGRMTPIKNPLFVVDILASVLKERQSIYAVFVGQGDLESAVRNRAESFKVTDHIRMLGWRNDIPAIFQSADLFVFPRVEHPKEGLGLVVIEAQAAGLPMLLSSGIVEDAIIIHPLAHFLPNITDVGLWSSKILEILDAPPACSKTTAFEQMLTSPFELSNATQNLLALYES